MNKPVLRIRESANIVITWVSFLVRLIGQIGYFLLVARALGPHDYGMAASAIALLIIVGSFAGWGGDHVVVKHVTADPARFADYFGHALILIAITLVPLTALSYGISILTIGMEPLAFMAFALAELLFTRLFGLAVTSFMAFERGGDLLVVNGAFSVIRLATCLIAIRVSSPLDLESWARWSLGGAVASGLFSLVYMIWRLGPPRRHFARGDLALGFHFCLQYVADTAIRDIDKPLVAYFAGPVAAGLYNAGFRVVDAVAMPLRALIAAFYARFFKHGHRGIEHSFQFAVKVLPLLLVYSVLSGVILIVGSAFLPFILGDKFRDAAPVVTRLAFLPVFNVLVSIGGDILTSTGRQHWRALVVAVLSFAPVLFSWLVVPRFGIEGAAYVALGNAFALAAAVWVLVILSRRDAARQEAAEPLVLTAGSEAGAA